MRLQSEMWRSRRSNHPAESARPIDSFRSLCYPVTSRINSFRCPLAQRTGQDDNGQQADAMIDPTNWKAVIGLLCVTACCLLGPDQSEAARKSKAAPKKQPDLRIVDVRIKPVPYVPSHGELQFTLAIDLPPDVERTALLEVTCLLSSPSKTSLRFLTYRQPITPLLETIGHQSPHPAPAGDHRDRPPSPRVTVTLNWDGMDHTRQEAQSGQYRYELRAKIIGDGDNTPRTLTVSWPKRGTMEVR